MNRIQGLLLCLFALHLGACTPMAKHAMKVTKSASYTRSKPAARMPSIAHNGPLLARDARLPAGIEEADIVRRRGHKLFYLHTRRGFLQIDIKDPRQPYVQSALPIYGKPVEMFFEGQQAFILVNDALYLRQAQGRFYFAKQSTARLVRVDLRGEGKIISVLDIPGRLREGVSRKQGKTLFVVSQGRQRQLQLSAIDVSKARRMSLVQRASLLPRQGSYYRRVVGVRGRVYYRNQFAITATPKALMVATLWSQRIYHTNGWRRRWSFNRMVSRVSVFRLHSRRSLDSRRFSALAQMWLPGQVQDQFKQSYTEQNGRHLYLGLTLQNRWVRSGRRRYRQTRNMLYAYDLRFQRPRLLSKIRFGKRFETLRGSAFDHDRQVVYAITALQKPPHEIIDPLYAISYKNPKHLEVLSQIDNLSGDMNLFRFIEGRRFLLAVGRDTSGHCKGFGRSVGRSRTSISIIDVRKLRGIRLVQRKCFSPHAARDVLSAINRNRDQGHKMIGMLSDGALNFVTVPLYFRGQIQTPYGTRRGMRSAVGLMQWDLKSYIGRPTRSPSVLRNRGVILHPQGRVRRTMLLKRGRGYLVLNLSPNHLSIAGLQPGSRHSLLSSLPLKTHIQRSFRVGKTRVYLRRHGWGRGLTHSLLLRPHRGKAHRVSIGKVERIFPWRKGLAWIGWRRPQIKGSIPGSIRRAPQRYLQRLDLSDPKKPRLLPPHPWRLNELPPQVSFCVASRSCRTAHRPGAFQTMLRTSHGFGWISSRSQRVYGLSRTTKQLTWIQMDPKAAPKVKTFSFSSQGSFGFVPIDDGQFFLLRRSARHTHGWEEGQRWRYHRGQWRTSSWRPIPGRIFSAYHRNKQLFLLAHRQSHRKIYLFRWGAKTMKLLQTWRSAHGAVASALRWKDTLAVTTNPHRSRSVLTLLRLRKKGFTLLFRKAYLSMSSWAEMAHRSKLYLQLSQGRILMDLASPRDPKLVWYRPKGSPLHQVH